MEPGPDAKITAWDNYGRALSLLRQERPDMARAAYLDEDASAAAERFHASAEFRATKNLLRNAGLPNGGKVLDLGAGNGMASCAFAMTGYDVCAAEPSAAPEYGTPVIEQIAARAGVGMRVVQAQGENLPLEAETFDCVYIRQCLHHADDMTQVLKEAARTLKVNGILFVAREHVITDEADLRRFRAMHPMVKYGIEEHAYRVGTYRQAIENAGLRVEKVIPPLSIPLTLDPSAVAMKFAPVTRVMARLTGKPASERMTSFLGRVLFCRPARFLLNRLAPRPGREYSFLARKTVSR